MSQIKLSSSVQNPDNLVSMVGSEAKNPLPTKTRGNFSWDDIAGLSWIFIEDPMNIGDYV